jgi:hypothetical protein
MGAGISITPDAVDCDVDGCCCFGKLTVAIKDLISAFFSSADAVLKAADNGAIAKAALGGGWHEAFDSSRPDGFNSFLPSTWPGASDVLVGALWEARWSLPASCVWLTLALLLYERAMTLNTSISRGRHITRRRT